MSKKYEYSVTAPMLPPRELRRQPDSPMMDSRDMEWWLNSMGGKGWELVTYGQKNWCDATKQEWWIFKKEPI